MASPMLVGLVGAGAERPRQKMLVIGINLEHIGRHVGNDADDGQRKQGIEAAGQLEREHHARHGRPYDACEEPGNAKHHEVGYELTVHAERLRGNRAEQGSGKGTHDYQRKQRSSGRAGPKADPSEEELAEKQQADRGKRKPLGALQQLEDCVAAAHEVREKQGRNARKLKWDDVSQ